MPTHCVCGASLKDQPYHHLHCTRFQGSRVSTRHNRIRDVLVDWSRTAGVTTLVEEPVADNLRMDAVMHFPDHTEWVDIRGSDPMAKSHVRRASVDPAATEEKALAEKNRVYGQKAVENGAQLKVFEIDSTGALGKQAMGLILELNGVYQRQFDVAEPSFVRECKLAVACCLQRANCDCISAGLIRSRSANAAGYARERLHVHRSRSVGWRPSVRVSA
jgi:hypothetical protein